MNGSGRLPIWLVLGVLWGCAPTTRLDRSTIPGGDPEDGVSLSQVPARGFFVDVDNEDPFSDAEGELLAVEQDNLMLLTEDGAVAMPLRRVKRVRIELYPSDALVLAAWSVGGILSTVSHGFFLILTAPAWLILGGGLTIHSATTNKLDVEPGQFDKLYQFARFPAGLPSGYVARQKE